MVRPRRLASSTYTGRRRYFLNICVNGRRAVFADPDICTATMVQIRRTAVAEGFAILAYCLMPDHAHLLVEGLTATADFRKFAKMAKQRSGGAYARKAHRPLWQEGYFDRVLRDADDAVQIARYIVLNPVRAGLVASPMDYPPLGCVWDIEKLIE